jgi:putative DNA-invertase from lambdoid prophage Rac
MGKHIAIYVRPVRPARDAAGQEAGLADWLDRGWPLPERRYRDGAGFERLLDEIHQGRVWAVAVWRLHVFGRTVRDLATLCTLMADRGTRLEVPGDDLSWAHENLRTMAKVLAAAARGEAEARTERIAAGQAAARAQGRRVGRPCAVSAAQAAEVRHLIDAGRTITAIARIVGVSKPTIYAALRRNA